MSTYQPIQPACHHISTRHIDSGLCEERKQIMTTNFTYIAYHLRILKLFLNSFQALLICIVKQYDCTQLLLQQNAHFYY
jgi:hypothetical protein